MSIFDSTRVAYAAGLPTITGTVTLFNSVTAFPPGGSFHLLGQQWFQYSLRTASAAGTATGTVTGSYSTDKGVTWIPFYSKATADAVAASTATVADVFTDDVYVGAYKDIRFQYTNAVEVLTVFDPLLSLHSKKPVSKVRESAALGMPDTFPVLITDGAVTSWFRLAHPDTVITGSGYSSVRDVLNSASPATQSTDSRRPVPATSANGLPILSMTAQALVIPLTTARAGTLKWGFWGWLKRNTGADNICSFGTTPGSNVNRLYSNVVGAVFRAQVFNSDSSQSRNCDVSSGTINTWKFFTIEYNSDFAGDLAMCMTVDGTPIVPTFSGVLGAVPSSLRAVTGNCSFGAFSATASFPFVGSMGGNWGFFGGSMAGVTTGLLTPAARTALMNFEAPT
jgi:hypothetical protein